jgi:hypothetical protein
MLDESDQSIRSCPLKAYKTIHITATPFNYPKMDKVVTIKQNENYHSINNLKIELNDNYLNSVQNFLITPGNGILNIPILKK